MVTKVAMIFSINRANGPWKMIRKSYRSVEEIQSQWNRRISLKPSPEISRRSRSFSNSSKSKKVLILFKSNQIQVRISKFKSKSLNPSINQAKFSINQVFNKSSNPGFKPGGPSSLNIPIINQRIVHLLQLQEK